MFRTGLEEVSNVLNYKFPETYIPLETFLDVPTLNNSERPEEGLLPSGTCFQHNDAFVL